MDFKIVTDNKQLSDELAELLEDKGQLCLTLTLPLEKLNPLREANERKLKEAIKKAATYKEHTDSIKKELVESLLKKLTECTAKTDWLHVSEGIGFYVSEKNVRIYNFDFAPSEKIIWSDRFMLRDLMYQLQIDQPFLILTLTETKSYLFEKRGGKWQMVLDNEINRDYADNYLYEKPSRSTLQAGSSHVKSFERDPETLEAAHRLPHLLKIKHHLKSYQNYYRPLVVIANDRLHHEINFTNKSHEPIIKISKDPSHYTPTELGELAIPYVYKYVEKKIEKLIEEWEELVGKGFTRSGLQACWRAAQEGNCKILLVEFGYTKPGFLLSDPFYLFLKPPAAIHTILPDAADDLLKTVLSKGGTVFFTANDLLSTTQHVALITRY
jgi:hypothetical protein